MKPVRDESQQNNNIFKKNPILGHFVDCPNYHPKRQLGSRRWISALSACVSVSWLLMQ